MTTSLHSPAAILTGRGTTGIWAALKALGAPGGEVLLPVNACEVVTAAVWGAGMRPLYHDVDPLSGNATLELIRAAWRPEAVALTVVHNFGTPLPADEICAWARGKGLFVLEDACNALGACQQDEPVGSRGDAAVFSFGHAKILDLGQGGALLVPDDRRRRRIQGILETLPRGSREFLPADRQFQAVLREMRREAHAARPALYRALYREYLPHLLYMPDAGLEDRIRDALAGLEQNLARRRELASAWRERLQHPDITHRPQVEGDVYWRFCLLLPPRRRGTVLKALWQADFLASTWFPPVHRIFDDLAQGWRFPGAESFAARVVNLSVDPEDMTLERVEAGARIILETLEQTA